MGRPRKADRAPYDGDTLTQVALRVFSQRGFDGTSVEDIAKAAGITKSSLYHHVASKEELLARGLDRALDALFAVLQEDQARKGPAIDRLSYVIRSSVEVQMRLLPEVTVLLRTRGNTETERRALDRRREFDHLMAELARAAQDEGDVRTDIDATVMTRLVLGMINWLTEWYRPDGPVTPAEIVDDAVKLALDGIRCSSDPAA